MNFHILIIVRLVTVNRSQDKKFSKESCLTTILNQQNDFDMKINVKYFFEESMKRTRMFNLVVKVGRWSEVKIAFTRTVDAGVDENVCEQENQHND